MPKRWSTKDLQVVEPPTAGKTGRAWFRFTDDYSVFHYSKMPDQIPRKGEAMARMASTSLRMINDAGIPTHFIDFAPPDRISVRLLRIVDPAERALSPADWNRLIPLQVICRNMLPQGASVFRRLNAGTVTLGELGLEREPVPGQMLQQPMIEFTTKLEEIDRHITHGEAQELAGLDETQFARVKSLTLAVNSLMTHYARSLGLVLADGKVEFGIDDEGQVILVDTAGTLDENRFLRHGVHFSKQLLRNCYLPTGLEENIQHWVAQKRPRDTWPQPPRLSPDIVALASDLYQSMAERWSGQRVWGAPDIDQLSERLLAYAVPAPP